MLRLTLTCAFLIASISAAPVNLTNQLSESSRGHPRREDEQNIDKDGNPVFIPPTRRSSTYHDAQGNAHALEADDGNDCGSGTGSPYFDDTGNKISLTNKCRGVSPTCHLQEGY